MVYRVLLSRCMVFVIGDDLPACATRTHLLNLDQSSEFRRLLNDIFDVVILIGFRLFFLIVVILDQ